VGECRMNCRCKGSCRLDQFKETYDTRVMNGYSYRLGYGRCSECEYYIKEVNYCPCCGDNLRYKPRNNKSRRLYNESMGYEL